ncbi:replication protein RepA [Pseudomonas sp. LPH60]|uniref:replication protein RepA n=1 Tax=Pseudomonas sp. LPH60 TaxID=3065906 RepID=UPI00273B10E5|nr:replication protein RepA [Pseudomonas sp. LPH60]MDP4573506.1 replication protein RepA [Pseudomonas sp. LPH60]
MSLLQFLSKPQREYAEKLIADGISVETAIAVAQQSRSTSALTKEVANKNGAARTGDLLSQTLENSQSATELASSVLALRNERNSKLIISGESDTKNNRAEKIVRPVWDYRNQDLPARVRDLIEAHLQIESDDAKSAGNLGFMTRALAIATLPHRKTDDFRFVRRNGDFTLTMLTAHPEGLPYGTLPRLLLTWVATEVVKKKDPVLFLGNTLADYLQELGLHSTGGKRGDITRLKHAMTTLFSSMISCHYDGKDGFALQNVLLADEVWWKPQAEEEAGKWQSRLLLSKPFFTECLEHPVPVDLRAMKVLRQSPLALDIYVWLTHRMSYLRKRTTIPWWSLTGQFGSGYAQDDQGLRDFRRAFLRELKKVLAIYPTAKVSNSRNGLVLYPSPTHVLPEKTPKQPSLPF